MRIPKLRRANGECLGDRNRRRTWEAAISYGEVPTYRRSVDVRMGKPSTRHGVLLLPEHIGQREGTRGTETSKYPEERKVKTTP